MWHKNSLLHIQKHVKGGETMVMKKYHQRSYLCFIRASSLLFFFLPDKYGRIL